MGGLDLEVLFHHRRDPRRFSGRRGGLWHGYGLLDSHCGANYKILPPDPIGLPPPYVFSTSPVAHHSHPEAKSITDLPRKRCWSVSGQLTCRAAAPKTQPQFEPGSHGKRGIQGENRWVMYLCAMPC